MGKEKNAIAYIRVSRMGVSSEKYKDKESPETQMQHIQKYCELKGYKIISKYEDLDYSGGNDERPGFQKMFFEVRNNPDIDAVIVYNLSRFARDVLDLNKYLVELEKHNVDFVSCTEEFLRTDTMYGKFLINIIGAVAQLQREQIAESVRDNMRNRALRGEFLGGVPPFGFRLNNESQKFEIVQGEAEVVRLIFNRYIAGEGILKIRNYLNSNNVLGRNDYSVGTLQSILKNIHYTGDFVYSKRRNISRTRKKKTSEDEWITVENNHPAIITKQEFILAQSLMKKRNRSKPENLDKRISGNQFLSGLLRCSCCGHTYYHGPKRNSVGTKFDYYVCGGYKTKGRPYCTNKRGLRIDRLDSIIKEAIVAKLKHQEMTSIFEQSYNIVEEEIEKGENEAKNIKQHLNRLTIEKEKFLLLIIRTENQQLIAQYENEIVKRDKEITKLEKNLKEFETLGNNKKYFSQLKKLIDDLFTDDFLIPVEADEILKYFIKKIEILDEENEKRTKLLLNLSISKNELILLKKFKQLFNPKKSMNNEKQFKSDLNKILENYKSCVLEAGFAPPVSRAQRPCYIKVSGLLFFEQHRRPKW